MSSEVTFPSMRAHVADALAGLADLDYQKRAWLAGEVPDGTYDDLTLAVHIL